MKRFVLTILMSMLTFVAISQQTDYPKYATDSAGTQIVMLTIEQAMTLDNNSELLGLFEKLNAQIGQYDSACIKVINEKEKVIAIQKVEIAGLNAALLNKSKQIEALQEKIKEYLAKIAILEEQVKIKDGVIKEKTRQIRKLKIKMTFGGVGGMVAIAGLIVALILIH